MKFSTTLLALAIATSAAFAPSAFAQSADLSITGNIFPGACTVNVGNSGVADLGDINSVSLDPTYPTLLRPVALSLIVDCESEVRFALQGVDNVAESSTRVDRYGLGMTANDEKIGNANLVIADVTADGVPAHGTFSYDEGLTWNESHHGGHFTLPMPDLLGFTAEPSVDTGPAAIKNLQGTLKVIAQIQPTSAVTIDEDVLINGSATINVTYL
jgi:type 1 fimbria pilin